MTYVTPQVRVFQEFTTSATLGENSQRACILGANVQTRRFNEATEKAAIDVGLYDAIDGNTVSYPAKIAGSVVDLTSVKVFVENALLRYYQDTIGAGGLVVPNPTFNNRIRHSTVNFVANPGFPRAAVLNGRNVTVGDLVRVSGNGFTQWSTVSDFVREVVPSAVTSVTSFAGNAATALLSATVSASSALFPNCINTDINGALYDGRVSGDVVETYTITVIQSGIPANARLRVTSASGRDNVASVIPAAFAAPTTIGTRGLTVTFTLGTGACVTAAGVAGIPANEFIVGQSWTATVTQAFSLVCAAVPNPTAYTGTQDDTYIIEVTKGGLFATNPQISVRTAKNLDNSLTPVTVTAINTPVALGNFGLQISFSRCGVIIPEILGLRKGDVFVVQVTAVTGGAAQTIVLRDNLVPGLLALTDLELSIHIPKTIEITANRVSNPPLTNYTFTSSAVTVNGGVTAFIPEWASAGAMLPLPVVAGFVGPYNTVYGKLFVQYNESLPALASELNFAYSVADLTAIPGPLEPSNPLKYGVFKALENSSGAGVGYIAVADPAVLNSWQTALSILDSRPEIYTYVPMTYDTAVQQLCHAQAMTESGPESTNWKRVMVSAPYSASTQLVAVDSSNVTIIATITNNTLTGPSGNTLVTVAAGQSAFLQNQVRVGDTVRTLYGNDAFGASVHTAYIVDRVISDTQLVLTAGPSVAIGVPQKLEVWRTLTKTEIAQNMVSKAGVFNSHRAMLIAPDVAVSGTYTVPGFYIAAGLAGLISRVLPHQGLTRFPVAGFSDIKNRTRDFFTKAQLDIMADGGVWVVTEANDGSVYSRHAVTTSGSDKRALIEEVMGRNLDGLSYEFLAIYKPFIGVTNATPSVLSRIEYLTDTKLRDASTIVENRDLGPRIISGNIALDSAGNPIIRIHPLAADRVQVVVNIQLPGPNNVTDLYLIV